VSNDATSQVVMTTLTSAFGVQRNHTSGLLVPQLRNVPAHCASSTGSGLGVAFAVSKAAGTPRMASSAVEQSLFGGAWPNAAVVTAAARPTPASSVFLDRFTWFIDSFS
jgi:hypothetical protein